MDVDGIYGALDAAFASDEAESAFLASWELIGLLAESGSFDASQDLMSIVIGAAEDAKLPLEAPTGEDVAAKAKGFSKFAGTQSATAPREDEEKPAGALSLADLMPAGPRKA